MTWNHRVIREPTGDGYWGYSIHEVHYDDDGKPEMMTSGDMSPHGETIEVLRMELEMFSRALDRPVLKELSDPFRLVEVTSDD